MDCIAFLVLLSVSILFFIAEASCINYWSKTRLKLVYFRCMDAWMDVHFIQSFNHFVPAKTTLRVQYRLYFPGSKFFRHCFLLKKILCQQNVDIVKIFK